MQDLKLVANLPEHCSKEDIVREIAYVTTSPEPVWTECQNCNRSTRHSILAEVEKRGGDEYDYLETHSILECMGCGCRSFRREWHDIESGYPDRDDDEWIVPVDTTSYPKFNKQFPALQELYAVPPRVRVIYQESLVTIQEGALMLAGLGLRYYRSDLFGPKYCRQKP